MRITVVSFGVAVASFILTLFTALIAAGLATKAFSALNAGQLAIAGATYALISAMGIMNIAIQVAMVGAAKNAALRR